MVQNDSLGGLDARLEAICHPVRRELLYELRGASQEGKRAVCLDVFYGDSEDDARKLALRHRHLPKLAEHGFVAVGSEGDRVEPGPRFDDLHPLLDHLESIDCAAVRSTTQ